MCQYYSFVVDAVDPRLVYAGDGDGHQGIEAMYGLKPDSYREAEWVDETPESLTVRGLSDRESRELRAAVVGRWATRGVMLERIAGPRAAWDEAVAPARAARDKAVASARAARDKAMASARAAHDEAVASASAAYRAALTKD
jgi:hypothetical protein